MPLTQITAEPGVPLILITAEFGAPRELLFRAHTDPRLLVQWLGPRWVTMTIDRFDPQHGGIWRYLHWDPEGGDSAFRGVFHGTPLPDSIVQTFECEGRPGHVCLQTVTFTDNGTKTMLSQSTVFQSVEDRDRELESGMAAEVNESLERLDELLARIAPVR